jgi:hypothetical protein
MNLPGRVVKLFREEKIVDILARWPEPMVPPSRWTLPSRSQPDTRSQLVSTGTVAHNRCMKNGPVAHVSIRQLLLALSLREGIDAYETELLTVVGATPRRACDQAASETEIPDEYGGPGALGGVHGGALAQGKEGRARIVLRQSKQSQIRNLVRRVTSDYGKQ